MSSDVIVASLATVGGIITAVIVGMFSIVTSRSSRKVSTNTTELSALSDHALALIEHYKIRAEVAESLVQEQNKALATQREVVDRLLERQDALRKEPRRVQE